MLALLTYQSQLVSISPERCTMSEDMSQASLGWPSTQCWQEQKGKERCCLETEAPCQQPLLEAYRTQCRVGNRIGAKESVGSNCIKDNPGQLKNTLESTGRKGIWLHLPQEPSRMFLPVTPLSPPTHSHTDTHTHCCVETGEANGNTDGTYKAKRAGSGGAYSSMTSPLQSLGLEGSLMGGRAREGERSTTPTQHMALPH